MEKECQNIEYKSVWRDEYLAWICGYANAQGGELYIGISDDKQVVGIKDAEKLLESIPNKVTMTLGIVIEIDLHKEGDKEYISIHVDPTDMPISYRGKYYYRSGSTMQELNGIALQQFILKKMHLTWESMPQPTATMDDIDPEAIQYFIKKGVACGRLDTSVEQSSIENILSNLRLLDSNGHLTNAALVLFGKDPQKYCIGCRFRIGRFHLRDSELISHDEITGNILQMADEVMRILRNKYLIMTISYEGMQRIETLEIPEQALREIIYNALIHRNYLDSDIQMKVFDDHIELWNGGELPTGYDSLEQLMTAHMSKAGNPLIARTFFRAGFIENWGRGYDRIEAAIKNAGLTMPIFNYSHQSICVSLKREVFMRINGPRETKIEGINGGKDGGKELTDRQNVIISFISSNGGITMDMLTKQLKVGESTILRELTILKNANLIRRVGGRKSGHWEVVQ